MSELTKGPWKAKRLATYQEPGWVVLWPDKGGTHMRRLDSNGNFTGPDAALIAAAHERPARDCGEAGHDEDRCGNASCLGHNARLTGPQRPAQE